MPIRSLNFGATSYLKSTYEVAKNLTHGKNSYILTGANDFNGTRWFNKEKMESSLWYMLAAVSMYCPRIMRENIYKLYRTLNTAQKNANYKCEDFIAPFQPVKKPAAKRRTTATKTKATAEKKSSTEKKSGSERKTLRKSKKSEADSKNSKQK